MNAADPAEYFGTTYVVMGYRAYTRVLARRPLLYAACHGGRNGSGTAHPSCVFRSQSRTMWRQVRSSSWYASRLWRRAQLLRNSKHPVSSFKRSSVDRATSQTRWRACFWSLVNAGIKPSGLFSCGPNRFGSMHAIKRPSCKAKAGAR